MGVSGRFQSEGWAAAPSTQKTPGRSPVKPPFTRFTHAGLSALAYPPSLRGSGSRWSARPSEPVHTHLPPPLLTFRGCPPFSLFGFLRQNKNCAEGFVSTVRKFLNAGREVTIHCTPATFTRLATSTRSTTTEGDSVMHTCLGEARGLAQEAGSWPLSTFPLFPALGKPTCSSSPDKSHPLGYHSHPQSISSSPSSSRDGSSATSSRKSSMVPPPQWGRLTETT